MQRFVQGGDGPQPQENRPRTANRSELANLAKVGGPQRAFPQQQSLNRAQSNNASCRTPPENQQYHQSGFNHRIKQDVYDTDAESINTTIQSQNPQPEYSHVKSEGQQYDDNEGDEYGSDYEDEDGDDFEGISDQLPEFEQQLLQGMNPEQQKMMQERMNQRGGGFPHGVFEEGDSYPTTTSGIPDDYPDEMHAQGRVSPTPQPELEVYQGFSQPSQPVQNTGNAQGLRRPNNHQNQKQNNILQRGAELRANDRTGNVVNQHQAGRRQMQHELQSSQPPTYSQSVANDFEQHVPKPNARAIPTRQVNQALPQRGAGARAPIASTTAQGNRYGQPAAPGQRTPPVTTTEAHRKPLSPTSEAEPQRPIEDYDRKDLFEMDYDDLKTQDFDENPRASPPVLSDEVSTRPLVDRLEYVHEHLDEPSQAKFFTELKLAEWEEAGDWFLDRFQDIITRTRNARREKRKLAAEIEREVEQRHRHVAKKRRQVDEALGEMGQHGNTLLERQRTPSRSSRSPAFLRS